MRRWLLAALLCASPVAPAQAEAQVELVVSLCREKRLHFVQTVAEEVLRGLSVLTTYYAKCGPHPDVPDATPLENVGREAHTFLHHMVTRYDSLAPITFFINGGMGATSGSTESVFITSLALAHLGARAHFADKTLALSAPAPRAEDSQWGGSTRDFLQRAREECPDPSACCKLCRVSHCCRLFGAGLCPLSEDRLFDEQSSCSWGGKNEANYNHSFDRHLRPASPPSFALWLEERWGLSIHTFEKQQWSPGGIFAVAQAGIRAWPLERLRGAREELAASGVNGGMAGHFYERVWRTLFSTAHPEGGS